MARFPVVAARYWEKGGILVAGHHLLLQKLGQ